MKKFILTIASMSTLYSTPNTRVLNLERKVNAACSVMASGGFFHKMLKDIDLELRQRGVSLEKRGKEYILRAKGHKILMIKNNKIISSRGNHKQPHIIHFKHDLGKYGTLFILGTIAKYLTQTN